MSLSPARRGAERDGDPDHAAGRGRGPQRQGVDEINSTCREGNQLRPSSSSRSARRSTAPSTTSRRHRPDPRRPARRHPRAAGSSASTLPATPIAISPPKRTDMTLEQLSWYVDNTVAKRLLAVDGHRRGHPRRRRRPPDPRRSSIRPRCRRRASPPRRSTSSCAQINLNAAGGRAEIAGSEQSVRVLGNAARRLRSSAQTQISSAAGARCSSPTSRQVTRRFGEQRSIAKMHGRQVVSFNIQRAKGSSDVTVYDDAVEGAAEDREGKSAGQVHRALQHRSITPRTSMTARCRRWSKARSSPSSSSSCSCATCARR